MARSRRSARASRTFTGFVVVAVFVGGAVQLRRVHNARDAARAVAVRNAADHVTVSHPSAVVVSATTTQPSMPSAVATVPRPAGVGPLISMTPALGDATLAHAVLPAMAVSLSPTNGAAPASVVSGTSSFASPTPAPVTAQASAASPMAAPSVSEANAAFTAHPLAEAQTLFASGDLVASRKTLNDALEANVLSPSDVQTAKQHIAQINQTLIFSTDKFADDPFGGVVVVKPGQRLSAIANQQKLNWQLLCDLNHLSDPRKLRSGQRLKVLQGPFTAIVTKHSFMMDLYLGGAPGTPASMYVRSYPIGLGKDDSTPTGTWMIANRVKSPTYYSPRGEGVIEAGDPKNPLGPCWMGLTGTDGQAVGKESYGIHGTIEPDSIGHMASMGCIRMHNEDALAVFQLLTEAKSTVVVRD